MGWNQRKVESRHKTLAKRFVKTTQRAEMESASLESLKQELNISLEDTEQWVWDVKHWAATEKPRTQEELQREIDEMIYSLRRKKHDLYRQNDSNQTRGRKQRRLSELKKTLREKVLHYNTITTCEEKVDIEAACSLSEDVILPWKVQGDDAYHVIGLAYKFLLTLSVTQVACERTFSTLKFVKNRLRTSMSQDRLEAFLLMSTEKELLMELDSDGIIDKMAESSALMRRMLTF
ncbi:uncharacterized protein LOC115580951 [Sparus aurata]|uniref:uncharacterized protein LOC115580951 n=1 Tax=Sparus aurata TaxID=8175 RepID=UPI0011C0EBF5|nr:uncharacterized protein LOC115580951 [Sparus aurata]